MKTRILSVARLSFPLAAALAALLATPAAHAASVSWDGTGTGGTGDGTGVWDSAGKWWNGSTDATWVSGSDAVFGHGGAGSTVTLGAPTTVNSLTLNSFTGTYTLGTATQAITLNAGITMNSTAAAVSIISPLISGGVQTWTNNSTSTLTFNSGAGLNLNGNRLTFSGTGNFTAAAAGGTISGAGGITMSGTGRVILGAAATTPTLTYSGDTIVNSGIIQFSNNSSANTCLILQGGVYAEYFTATMNRALGTAANQIQVLGGASGFGDNGAAVMTINLGGASAAVQWGSTYFQPTTFVLGDATTANNGCSTVFQNPIDLNGADRTVSALGLGSTTSATLSGILSTSTGTAGLIKNGPAKLILSGANTFNGAVTVNQGILSVSSINTVANANPLGKSSAAASNLVLAPGTTLQFTGAAASCDRSFTLNGAANGDYVTLDASGSGALNLTNTATPAFGTNNQARTLYLTGTNTGTNILAAVLTNNGSGALSVTKNGAGLWTLSGANTYTGPTTINAGTLSITGSLTGTAITTYGGIINESAAGAIGGAVSFTQAGGSGTSVLSGTNTYSGTTTVFSGTVQFSKQVSLYNNTPASWTAANINVKSLATLAVNVDSAGTAGFSSSSLDTLLGNISVANSASQGLQSGAFIGLDTSTATGGTFTQGNLIADTTGTNGGVLGLAKLGAGTLILDKTNTYTGRTIISAGVLQLGSGGTTGSLSTSSVIVNNGTLTINRSNAVAQGTDFSGAPITGTGGFTQAGSGNTTLSAANTFSGVTTVSGGTLTLTNALALQNSALVTTGAGTVVLSGFTTPTFGGLSGATGSLATIISSGYTGTSLTINPTAGSVTYGGVISDSSPGMALIKNGAGTQILTGANTYTGTTTINLGTLTIGNGTLGSLNGTTGTALTFGGTGTFNVAEATGSTQGMGALTFSIGAGTVTSTAANATATQTVTFASMPARPVGATGNFTLATNTTAASNKIVLTDTTNAPLNNSGSNNPGLFFGTSEYARYDTTNNYFRAVTYGTDTNAPAIVATGTTIGTTSSATDIKVSGNITAQTTTSVNTLNLAATTMTFTNAANVLSVNGIISSGATLSNTTTVSLIQPAVAGGELVINATAGNTTINQIIQNNTSASSLTKSGAGTLVLNSNASTYTGGTVVNAGSITTATGGASTVTFFGSGPITINPGATLALNNTWVSNNVTLNSATVTAGNSFGSTMSGSAITLNGISTFNITGNLTVSGSLTGTGGLIKTGGSNVPFTGTNTYTGPTTISVGPLTFSKPAALYNGTTASWTPANITVASGATLGINFGGVSDFNNAQVTTLLGNLTTGLVNNGLLAGSAVAFDTSNGSGNYSGNITDSTGAGGGSVGFNKIGGNTLTLSGNNTFSGPASAGGPSGTTGGTLAVYSFNSVNGGSPLLASSSLGRPTTVANGTITLGNASNNTGVGLTYLGTGETTDRVLAMNSGIGAGGTALTLDQSGTGLLKFTSPFIFTGATGSRILQLQGSTAGTGEWAAVLADVIPNTFNTLGITKAGTGTWTLSAANVYNGVTTINGGALVLTNATALPGGIGATGGTSALTFNGGVLGLGAGDFTRNLAAAGTVNAACFSGTGGGWAAYGADRIVNLNNDSHQITWATANTGFNGLKLILGNATATNTVDLQNPLDMGNAARTIQVDNGSAAIDGKLSGVLTGTVGGNLTKTGTGALALTNTNTYVGTTTIQAGGLLLGTNAPVSANGALGNASSAIVLGNGSTAATDAPAILVNGAFTVARDITVDSAANTNAYNATIGGTNTSGTATYSGNITLGTNTQYTVTLQAAPGGTVEFTGGTWTTNNKPVTIGTATNTGAVKLSNSITTSGGVTVAYGTLSGTGNVGGNLTINSGAHHALAVAATAGAQVTRAITGTLTLTAGNILDLSAATTPAAGTYVLATATTAITGAPTTINYNGVPGVVSVDTVSSPQRLLLTVTAMSGYAGWASTNAPTGTAADDYNGDGVSNGVEYILGGDKNHNNLSKLPTITTSGGNMIFSFKRDQTTVGNATVTIQVGTTLASWPDSYTVGTDTSSSSPGVTIVNGVPTGFDTVTLTLTQAPDVKKFARLNVVIP